MCCVRGWRGYHWWRNGGRGWGGTVICSRLNCVVTISGRSPGDGSRQERGSCATTIAVWNEKLRSALKPYFHQGGLIKLKAA